MLLHVHGLILAPVSVPGHVRKANKLGIFACRGVMLQNEFVLKSLFNLRFYIML